MKKRLTTLIGIISGAVYILCACAPLFAQSRSATLVRDICTSDSRDSTPLELTDVNGVLYFSADDGEHGRELFRSNADPNGTFLIRDINPGVNGSYPTSLTAIDGKLYFQADDGIHGPEIWVSDGTPEGTYMIQDLWPGPEGAEPYDFYPVDKTIYFHASTLEFGRELWVLPPGATEATVIDIVPGPDGSGIGSLTQGNGVLYFMTMTRIWKIDPAQALSVPIQLPVELEPVDALDYLVNGSERYLTFHDGYLYLRYGESQFDGYADVELWRIDPNGSGLTCVKNIKTGSDLYMTWNTAQYASYPSHLTSIGGYLYFVARRDDETYWIHRTDGTEDGTVALGQIFLIDTSYGEPAIRPFRVFDGGVYWSYSWLYLSEGDPENMHHIDPDAYLAYAPDFFVMSSGRVYFAAEDPNHGIELWEGDFTTQQSSLLCDINPGPDSSRLDNLVDVNGTLFFTADDGVHGLELWCSDGTTEGTRMVKDLGAQSSVPRNLTVANGELLFYADPGIDGRGLWTSDGTRDGTLLMCPTDAEVHTLTAAAGRAYFTTSRTPGATLPDRRVWVSNSTLTDADQLTNDTLALVNNRQRGSNPCFPVVVGDCLYFRAYRSGVPVLWRTYPEATDAQIVSRIEPLGSTAVEKSPTYPRDLTAWADKVIFSAYAPKYGYELWVSDGTDAGTSLIKDINRGTAGADPQHLTPAGDYLFFTAVTSTQGRELWKTPGRSLGTALVKDINRGSPDGAPDNLTWFNDLLYFSADNGTNGRELWTSDGRATRTKLLLDIFPGSEGSDPDSIIPFGPHLYFSANDGTNGRELWTTDGTAEGTFLLADICPGSQSSDPAHFSIFNGRLYFTAYHPDTGIELYSTDGTTEGTALVQDISLGPDSSRLSQFTPVNDLLFFTAYTPDTGTELWKLDPALALAPPGDLHPDGRIDHLDLIVFAQWWLQTDCGACAGADLSGNDEVDFTDFAQFIQTFAP